MFNPTGEADVSGARKIFARGVMARDERNNPNGWLETPEESWLYQGRSAHLSFFQSRARYRGRENGGRGGQNGGRCFLRVGKHVFTDTNPQYGFCRPAGKRPRARMLRKVDPPTESLLSSKSYR